MRALEALDDVTHDACLFDRGDRFWHTVWPSAGGGAKSTVAQGINAEGTVVGAFVDSGGKQHGFLLSGGNFTTVDFAGAIATGLRGINDRGAMVDVHVDVPGLPGGGSRGFL